jgi:hypothetical protein
MSKRWLGGYWNSPDFRFARSLATSARRIDKLHLAGDKRLARRADFGVDALLGAARRKLVATTAGNSGSFIFGMDVCDSL